MKKSNSTQKALGAFRKLGAVALITATMFLTACNQAGGGGNTGGGGGKPTPKPKHAITFSVEGANGTLKAVLDGNEITSGKEVEQDKEVTFTATANANYQVKGWTLDGSPITEAGKNTEYKLPVTKAATVKVSFEEIPKPKHAITFSVDSTTPNGKLKAVLDGKEITSGEKVEQDKEVTFTATADSGYRVNTWVISPNSAIQSGGGKGAATATLKITANTTVSVSFERIPEGAILTLATGKNTVSVMAKTEGDSDITVEGCNEKTFKSQNQTELHANGATVTLKGDIIELHVIGTYQIKGPLTALDVSGLAKLQKLNCEDNQLTSLNVQGCVALQEINCDSNQLTSLDVSNLIALNKLNCSYNKKSPDNKTLTELNVQGCTALQTLNCIGNKLTELDVQSLTGLQTLLCSQNKLNSLSFDVQGLTALEDLDCGENNLTALDVSKLTNLKKLNCGKNKLTTLNASGLTKLESLTCNENQLTAWNEKQRTGLKVQGCTSLKFLSCYGNNLNADAFIDIFNALPTRQENDNAIATLYTEDTDVTEGNCKNFKTPDGLKAAFDGAKTKKWKLMKMSASGIDEPIN